MAHPERNNNTLGKSGNSGADLTDSAHDLVSRYKRIIADAPLIPRLVEVRMTNATEEEIGGYIGCGGLSTLNGERRDWGRCA